MEDKGYFLHTIVNKEHHSHENFIYLTELINSNGFFKIRAKAGNSCKIYSPTLAFILMENEIQAKERNDDREILLKTRPYFKTYLNSYEKGRTEFNENFNFSSIYANNFELYISDLQEWYKEWWEKVYIIPISFSHTSVESIGFHAGLISKFKELEEKHKSVFNKATRPIDNGLLIDMSNTGHQNDNTKNPDINLNHWNEDCYMLFKYLTIEYTGMRNGSTQRFIDIWHYLRYNLHGKEGYMFAMPQEEYKIIIEKDFEIEIKKFNSDIKDNKEKRSILDKIFKNYREKLTN